MKKYLKLLFETRRTIVFGEYYFFNQPTDSNFFPKDLLYFLFLSKRIVILKKNNQLSVKRKPGIKNLQLLQKDDF